MRCSSRFQRCPLRPPDSSSHIPPPRWSEVPHQICYPPIQRNTVRFLCSILLSPLTNILHVARPPRPQPNFALNTEPYAASSILTLHHPRPSPSFATPLSSPLQPSYTLSRQIRSESSTERSEAASTAPGSPPPPTR